MSVELEQEVKEIEALDEKKNIQKWSFWKVFSSTFLTILFAEMGDKPS